MKKFLALLLAMMLLLTFVSCGEAEDEDDALEEETENTSDASEVKIGKSTFHFDYVDSETVYITGYDGPDTLHPVEIPETLNNKAVVKIGDGAFMNQSAISSITFPSSVTEIGSFAFCNCAGLKTLTIPATIASIGEGAFYGCTALATLTFEANGAMTEIAKSTFMKCTALKAVNIPSTINKVNEAAFFGCSSVEEINFAEGVVNIEQQAFQNCTALALVNVSTTVMAIGSYNFTGSDALYEGGFVYDKTAENAAILSVVETSLNLTEKPVTSDGEPD